MWCLAIKRSMSTAWYWSIYHNNLSNCNNLELGLHSKIVIKKDLCWVVADNSHMITVNSMVAGMTRYHILWLYMTDLCWVIADNSYMIIGITRYHILWLYITAVFIVCVPPGHTFIRFFEEKHVWINDHVLNFEKLFNGRIALFKCLLP